MIQDPNQKRMVSMSGNRAFPKFHIDMNNLKLSDTKSFSAETDTSADFQSNLPDHTPNKMSKKELKYPAGTATTEASNDAELSNSSQFLPQTPRNSCSTVHHSYHVPASASSQLPSCFTTASNTIGSINIDRNSSDNTLKASELNSKVSGKLNARTAPEESCSDMDQAQDLGYSSCSTEGCNNNERVDMDLGSQSNMDFGQGAEGWSGDHGIYCNDIEELLVQFKNFFKNRFEAELDSFQTAMLGVLEEQKNHVRQIVHRAIQDQSSQSQTSDDLFIDVRTESEDNLSCLTHSTDLKTANSGENSSQTELFDYAARLHRLQEASSQSASEEKHGAKKKDELFDLVRLSCSVSTLLAQHQFRA